MSEDTTTSKSRISLRKYPNRRYYDTTHSRYVTLEEIYALIRDGFDVQVADSKTGEDITAKVLAQIILEHDPPKLGVFPVELLHKLIRTNEPLVRDFVDKYFNQAFAAFLQSQRQFEQYLRQALGLYNPLPLSRDWTRMMMGPFAQAFFPQKSDVADGAPNGQNPAEQADLRRLVDQLREEVARLQRQVGQQP